MRIKREKGFTLIELMIVVAIIGILAAVAIPKFADLIDKAKEAKAKAALSSIRSAVTIYYGSMEGTATTNLSGLVTKYIKELPPVDFRASDTDKTVIEWAKDQQSTENTGTAGNTDPNKWYYNAAALETWIGCNLDDTKGMEIHTW